MDLPATIATDRGLSVEGAGPDLLDQLLALYEEEVSRRGMPFDELMGPGLDRDVVVAGFASIGVQPPEELIRWVAWHDPLPSPAWGHNAFPRLQRLPFAEALVQHEINVEFGVHPPTWFLVAGDQNGIVVSCEDAPASPPLVRRLDEDEGGLNLEDPSQQAVSLCALVTWWIETIDTNHRWWDGGVFDPEEERSRFLSIPERLRATRLM